MNKTAIALLLGVAILTTACDDKPQFVKDMEKRQETEKKIQEVPEWAKGYLVREPTYKTVPYRKATVWGSDSENARKEMPSCAKYDDVSAYGWNGGGNTYAFKVDGCPDGTKFPRGTKFSVGETTEVDNPDNYVPPKPEEE